jgi:predicted  nucleic acid-binding Zn-ribbon protein
MRTQTEGGVLSGINVKLNPELRNRLIQGELNILKCEKCGNMSVVDLVFFIS